jgi:cobalt/nickel transport system permease protein
VGAGHAHPLHRPGTSPVHRLPAEVKVVAAVLGAVGVVATPREAFGVFAGHLLVLAAIWAIARIPPGWILRRAVIELPFVVLAVLLPITGPGPRVDVWGVALSEPGLLGAWNIVVKGTLGVLISLTLAATTPLRALLIGLQRLRVPALVVTIATLMLRYADLILAEAARMRRARLARGHDPRFLWQVGATARGVGTLFVRTYERGERVHLAMLSRGFTGALPGAADAVPTRREWLAGLAPAAVALALPALAVLGRSGAAG